MLKTYVLKEAMMDPKKLGILMLIYSAFFWGSTFVYVKKTVTLIPLDGYLTIRFALAALTIFIFMLNDKNALTGLLKRRSWMGGTILGVFLYASYWFQTEGLLLTTPAKAAFITGFNVVLVPILGIWPFKNKVRNMERLAVVISLSGLALISLDFNNFGAINQGDLLVIVTAICIAYHVLFTQTMSDINLKTLVFIQLLIVSLASLITSIFRQSIWIPNLHEEGIVWFTLGITAFLATAFAFFAQTYAQNNGVKSSVVALIFTLEPLSALILDLFLGEIPNLQIIIGMIIILFSMVIISLKRPK